MAVQWAVFKSDADTVDTEATVSSASFEIQWEASNSTAEIYGWTVGQVKTKMSRKYFNKYLSKLQPLWLQFNLKIKMLLNMKLLNWLQFNRQSSAIPVRAMSTLANCSRNNGSSSMASF